MAYPLLTYGTDKFADNLLLSGYLREIHLTWPGLSQCIKCGIIIGFLPYFWNKLRINYLAGFIDNNNAPGIKPFEWSVENINSVVFGLIRGRRTWPASWGGSAWQSECPQGNEKEADKPAGAGAGKPPGG